MRSIHNHRSLIAVLLATSSSLLIAGSALAESATVKLVNADQPPIELNGGLDSFNAAIPIPYRWNAVQGSLKIDWEASSQVVKGSALQFRVGNQVVGTSEVKPGQHTSKIKIPRLALGKNVTEVPLAIEARLKTADAVCPTADDPVAWLHLDRKSAITLDGKVAEAPARISDTTQNMVSTVGRKRGSVLVRFMDQPTPQMLQAAGLAAGEVAAKAPSTGIKIRVALPGTDTRRIKGEPAIIIEHGDSNSMRVRNLGDEQSPVVTISGTDDQLVNIAAALRPTTARDLKTNTVNASSLPKFVAKRQQFPKRVKIPAGKASGIGKQTVSVGVRIPEYLEVRRGSMLRLSGTYDAPAGGRLVGSINGRSIYTQNLQPDGNSRFYFQHELASRGPALFAADLMAGMNNIDVQAALKVPDALRCRPSEISGGVSILPFGTITMATYPRRKTPSLSFFPYPLSSKAGWADSTIQLPQKVSEEELAAVLGMIAESRRVTNEVAIPNFQFGGETPKGDALILASPTTVPSEFNKTISGPKSVGVLAAAKTDNGSVHFLAIGAKALSPLANSFKIGKVSGRTVEVTSAKSVAVRVPDSELATAHKSSKPWKWPLLVIGGAALFLAIIAINQASVRLRRRLRSERRTAELTGEDPGAGDGENHGG